MANPNQQFLVPYIMGEPGHPMTLDTLRGFGTLRNALPALLGAEEADLNGHIPEVELSSSRRQKRVSLDARLDEILRDFQDDAQLVASFSTQARGGSALLAL